MDKCSQCVWWEENGDGSQMICDICHTTDASTNKRKQPARFISLERFDKKVKLAKPDHITKWRELVTNNIYRVCGVQERLVNINGKKKLSRYGELSDESGKRTNVWLPSLIDADLANYDVEAKDIYVRPLGMRNSKTGGRSYHDFDLIEDSDDDHTKGNDNDNNNFPTL